VLRAARLEAATDPPSRPRDPRFCARRRGTIVVAPDPASQLIGPRSLGSTIRESQLRRIGCADKLQLPAKSLDRLARMARIGVRSGSLVRSLDLEIWLNDAVWPNRRERVRTLLRFDKLGVTGSSPVPPTYESPAQAGFLFSGQ
jgi:hypothetical protein